MELVGIDRIKLMHMPAEVDGRPELVIAKVKLWVDDATSAPHPDPYPLTLLTRIRTTASETIARCEARSLRQLASQLRDVADALDEQTAAD